MHYNICITGDEAFKITDFVKKSYKEKKNIEFHFINTVNEAEDKNDIFSFFDAVFYYGASDENEFINFWTGHNHFRMINASLGEKELISEIDSFIGGDVHYEIEKKFIIKYPDISYLDNLKNAKKIYISQSYITHNGERKRIRKRGIDGVFSYYLTIKKNIDGFKKEEIEYCITEDEYENLKNQDKNALTIEKIRYCLSENFTYYEIDIYPFWNDRAVMEIELKDVNEEFVFPKNIEVTADVSSDKSYSNFNLALLNSKKNKILKFAVIGRNFVVDWFLSAAKQFENLSFEALYSRKYETGKEYADKYGVKKVYNDLNELALDGEIDFCYIASPNKFHKEQAMALLNSKKHVICEKPSVLSEEDFSEVEKCAIKNNCIFTEAIIPVHSPAMRKLKMDFEKIGKIHHVFLNYCQYSSRYDKFKKGIIENTFKKELGNGTLMDIGIYPVSVMEYLFGLPEKISAKSCFLKDSIDSNGAFVADYGDFLCEVIYSKVTDSFLPSEIQGEYGSILIDRMSRPFEYTIKFRKNLSKEDERIDIKTDKEDMYYEIENFIGEILYIRNTEYNTHSKNVLKITDEIRKQVGIKYEAT